jgi:hypothetical protein
VQNLAMQNAAMADTAAIGIIVQATKNIPTSKTGHIMEPTQYPRLLARFTLQKSISEHLGPTKIFGGDGFFFHHSVKKKCLEQKNRRQKAN